MITYDRAGGRKVELLLPFEYLGNKYEDITFSPVKYDHTVRWHEGRFSGMLPLMAELAHVDEQVIRELRYPDADRVMAVFVDMLPPEISASLNQAPPPPQKAEQPQGNGFDAVPPNWPPEPTSIEGQSTDPTGLGVDFNGA